MFLVHITNPKSFVFNFWGSLQVGAVFPCSILYQQAMPAVCILSGACAGLTA